MASMCHVLFILFVQLSFILHYYLVKVIYEVLLVDVTVIYEVLLFSQSYSLLSLYWLIMQRLSRKMSLS